MSFQPRKYQTDLSIEGAKILNTLSIVVLNFEVRTGKTFTSFMICELVKAKKVLFITKKKVIESKTIINDYNLMAPDFELIQINYESVHKITDKDIDIVIVDEIHSLGAFPKPSLRTKRIKELIGNKRIILLSGTLSPESFSQLYHIFWISNFSPFSERSFYGWARTYVDIKKRYVAHGNQVNDYSHANIDLINSKIRKYILSYTQTQAGFNTKVSEEILFVDMLPTTYKLIEILKKDLIYTGANGSVILGDTAVKLMQKVHQLYSGTVKLEDGTAKITDHSKAIFIQDRFQYKKIGIFYKFKEELVLLQKTFGENLTTDIHEFNNSKKNIALQIQAGREGISLKQAEYIIFYNIDFSATSYFQAKDRMTTMDRSFNKVYWIFAKGGLEEKIYRTVLNKKSFTIKHFENYERSQVPSEVN